MILIESEKELVNALHPDPYFPFEKGALLNVWNKLANVNHLTFAANSQGSKNSAWNGIGSGNVEVKQRNSKEIMFYETGSWTSKEGREFSFFNSFRWSLDYFKNWIMLEHLRFGEQNPVLLFHLVPVDKETLESVRPHVCKEDTYLGRVTWSSHFIKLNWRVTGPKKNECIDYMYINKVS